MLIKVILVATLFSFVGCASSKDARSEKSSNEQAPSTEKTLNKKKANTIEPTSLK